MCSHTSITRVLLPPNMSSTIKLLLSSFLQVALLYIADDRALLCLQM